ncbi:MAG TPA: maltotransferase domain-containing protein, partial [Microthrixaceae bacterium]|nr:maltotransferase domain-containing protein [Microthrixaceae bacterium]
MDAADRILIRWHQPPPVDDLPAKCIAGRPFHVAATIFRDGHGVLRSRVRWRAAGGQARSEVEWSEAPMVPGFDDLFRASFVPTTLGLHEYVVEAWTSQFETWRRDIRLRASVGEDVEAELLEGAAILDRLAPAVPRKFRRRVRDAVTTLRSTTCSSNVRMSAGLDDAVAEAVATVIDPTDHTSTGFRTVRVERERAAVGAWYEFFPRSVGGFAGGAVDRLDAIADMGFDVVYLPPIHPIGVTNRKGRNNSLGAGPGDPGSPWAIGAAEGGHTAMHPELGTFDDFDAFVARADELGLEVALDYALQCSPDHPWITEHPEWFHHLPDGSIRYAENPPKRYQDIHPINFWPEEEPRLALWNACHEILEFWIGHGVRIFRVDNPHTKPIAFWAWLLPEVWADHPDVVFLAEAFTHPAMMHELAAIGFSQSYTYFTWRTGKQELAEYALEVARGPASDYMRPNFW